MIFASADWVKASKPTPAALAARAYMLSCRWIDSERLAGVRGRERSISPPNRRHYCPLGVAASQSTLGHTTRPTPIDVMVRLRRFSGREAVHAEINLLSAGDTFRVVAEQFCAKRPKTHVSKNRGDVRADRPDCRDSCNHTLHTPEVGHVPHFCRHGLDRW